MPTDTPGAYTTAGAPWDNTTQMGIGVQKNIAGLKDPVTATLKEIVANGTDATLIEKWHLPRTNLALPATLLMQ